MPEPKRPLKVFLSYASQDKPIVRELSRRLAGEGWIDPWVDEKKLLPGHDWRTKIEEAVETSDIVIICLSSNSVTKEGFVQKELRYAREIAFEKPDETIFLIPLRLDDCIVPRGLRFYQWADYFGEKQEETYDALLESLKLRHEQKLKLEAEEHAREEKADQERIALEKKARKDAEETARLQAEESARQAKQEHDRKVAEAKRREKAKRDVFEKAKRERAERQATRIAALRDAFAKSLTATKSTLPKVAPFLRIAGIAGLTIAFLWMGSWRLSQLAALAPTSKATLTSTNHPSPSGTFTASPIGPTKTLMPNPTSTKTQTPAPTVSLSSEITDTSGVSMVLVPAGEFIMGSEDGDADEKPVREVYLAAFYIDKYEVTNSLYKACVDSDVCKSPAPSKDFDGRKYYGNTQFDDYPVTYIEWNQADIYCSWREAKLPTEAQWEKAARGTDGRTFPWGESINCNLANYNPACVGGMKKVGSYESGKSLYGIYDLAGNVWEWVADWYSPTYYQNFSISNPLGPENGEFRILRGGAWNAEMSKTRASYRFELSSIYFYRAFGESRYWPAWAATPSDANLAYYAGFRCAKETNP